MPELQRSSRRTFLHFSAVLAGAAALPRYARTDDGSLPSGKDLIVRSASPFNAEPALAALVAGQLTPIKHFYVRNHGPVPKVDEPSFKLRIEGMVNQPREWTLAELKRLGSRSEQEATLTCAGNRRQEVSAIKPVAGVQWDAGAIGHARWSGAKLRSLLEAAEVQPDAKHVWFEGLDSIKEKDGSVAPFGGSIPLEQALAKDAPVLLAHAMNGEALTAEHGFPLRAVVPGYIGARSVKWLTKITVSDRPSPNHYVAEAYKLIQTDDKAEVATAEPIYTFPVNSAICLPAADAKLKSGRTKIAGYALPSGEAGATLAKVELSLDGGQSWRAAKLASKNNAFSWQLWSADVELPGGKYELIVRATDSRGNMQPERGEWNLKGYLYHGWHRVRVEVT
jgi:sulfite oxidase